MSAVDVTRQYLRKRGMKYMARSFQEGGRHASRCDSRPRYGHSSETWLEVCGTGVLQRLSGGGLQRPERQGNGSLSSLD
jgi:hypothetical protein